MTKRKPTPSASPVPKFAPVRVRRRHDGWTPERQTQFIKALAECGCVADACRRVGMSSESAYALRRHYDAQAFRLAWDAALDYAIRRLSDAAFSRAIHGVPVPHYYKGELVGEHRRYDERLTQFLLRYRDPLRYAKSLDKEQYDGATSCSPSGRCCTPLTISMLFPRIRRPIGSERGESPPDVA
jgi:hypothetical protein